MRQYFPNIGKGLRDAAHFYRCYRTNQDAVNYVRLMMYTPTGFVTPATTELIRTHENIKVIMDLALTPRLTPRIPVITSSISRSI